MQPRPERPSRDPRADVYAGTGALSARIQQDIDGGALRVLDGESQSRIEVLTGKRLQQTYIPEPVLAAPEITSSVPTGTDLGGPPVTVRILGTGFMALSKVYWDGTELPGSGPLDTTFVSETELTCVVDPSGMVIPAGHYFEVHNPDGQVSNYLDFTVLPPLPVLTALEPNTTPIGVPSFDIHVKGTGFNAGSIIVFNGHDEPTTVVSETELTTGINMDVWTAPSNPLPVKVRNASGTESNELTFTFTAAAPGVLGAGRTPAKK